MAMFKRMFDELSAQAARGRLFWQTALPKDYCSGQRYHGLNAALLGTSAYMALDPRFITAAALHQLDLTLMPDAAPASILLWTDGALRIDTVNFNALTTVIAVPAYSLAQLDLPPLPAKNAYIPSAEAAQAFIASSPIPYAYSPSRKNIYSAADQTIVLSKEQDFASVVYAYLLYLLAHNTDPVIEQVKQLHEPLLIDVCCDFARAIIADIFITRLEPDELFYRLYRRWRARPLTAAEMPEFALTLSAAERLAQLCQQGIEDKDLQALGQIMSEADLKAFYKLSLEAGAQLKNTLMIRMRSLRKSRGDNIAYFKFVSRSDDPGEADDEFFCTGMDGEIFRGWLRRGHNADLALITMVREQLLADFTIDMTFFVSNIKYC